jgi:VanZ family protein
VKPLSLWGPVILLMGIIFYLSSLPDPGGPPGGLSDKTVHFGTYAALAALMVRALADGRADAVTAGRMLLAITAAAFYGVSDELHQRFVPGRSPEIADVLADAGGAAAGAVAAAIAAGCLRRSRRG